MRRRSQLDPVDLLLVVDLFLQQLRCWQRGATAHGISLLELAKQ